MIKLNNPIRPLIIAICGPSGAGKTTIAKELHNNNVFPTLVSYTTRPIRNNETDGVDHYFVTDNEMPEPNNMLAYTFFGGYHYWTSLSDLDKMKEYPHVYVIDEKGIIDLYELQNKGVIDLIWVQVVRNIINEEIDEKRKKRDNDRKEHLQYLKENNYKPDIIINNNTSVHDAVQDLKHRVVFFLEHRILDVLMDGH